MTTATPADGNDGAVPVACTLTSADLAAQSGRWERLAARAMTGRAETADGLRISFRPEPGAEDELRRLAAAETRCCPWADWAVAADAGRLVLEVRSTGEGIAVLHQMFTSLQPG
jgi:MerR family transcriptional regulator, copper efflux regulator